VANLQVKKAQRPKYKVRVYVSIVQTVPHDEEGRLSKVIERFTDRVIGIRRIVIQEFDALAKRSSKIQGFTDIKLLNGSVRTIATEFLKFREL
jgi:hypothetical protein